MLLLILSFLSLAPKGLEVPSGTCNVHGRTLPTGYSMYTCNRGGQYASLVLETCRGGQYASSIRTCPQQSQSNQCSNSSFKAEHSDCCSQNCFGPDAGCKINGRMVGTGYKFFTCNRSAGTLQIQTCSNGQVLPSMTNCPKQSESNQCANSSFGAEHRDCCSRGCFKADKLSCGRLEHGHKGYTCRAGGELVYETCDNGHFASTLWSCPPKNLAKCDTQPVSRKCCQQSCFGPPPAFCLTKNGRRLDNGHQGYSCNGGKLSFETCKDGEWQILITTCPPKVHARCGSSNANKNCCDHNCFTSGNIRCRLRDGSTLQDGKERNTCTNGNLQMIRCNAGFSSYTSGSCLPKAYSNCPSGHNHEWLKKCCAQKCFPSQIGFAQQHVGMISAVVGVLGLSGYGIIRSLRRKNANDIEYEKLSQVV